MRKTAWHRHRGVRRKAVGDGCWGLRNSRPRTVHVVRRGETLWAIASRYYKRGRRYDIVYRTNRSQIRNPNLIYPGQRLYIAHWKH
jgi:Tfp pilus assembly protein FimV